MTKRLLFTTFILVPAFFLVFLGMRNTALEHSRGPKQRPRAVVENPFKSEIIIGSCEFQADTDVLPVVAVPATPEKKRPSLVLVAKETPTPHPDFRATRAPPATLLS